jgi:hypothetical protein
VTLDEVADHRVHALARQLEVVALGAPRIGEALQLDHGVGIRLERAGKLVELAHAVVLQGGSVEVEKDRLRRELGELVAVGDALVQLGLGLAQSVPDRLRILLRAGRDALRVRRKGVHLAHASVEGLDALAGRVDGLSVRARTIRRVLQLRIGRAHHLTHETLGGARGSEHDHTQAQHQGSNPSTHGNVLLVLDGLAPRPGRRLAEHSRHVQCKQAKACTLRA